MLVAFSRWGAFSRSPVPYRGTAGSHGELGVLRACFGRRILQPSRIQEMRCEYNRRSFKGNGRALAVYQPGGGAW